MTDTTTVQPRKQQLFPINRADKINRSSGQKSIIRLIGYNPIGIKFHAELLIDVKLAGTEAWGHSFITTRN